MDGGPDMTAPRRHAGSWIPLACTLCVAGMVGLAYASVPLYSLFCQVTGFGGTTRSADQGADRVLDRSVTVRFDANTSRDMPWRFRPAQGEVRIKVGETGLAFFEATNTTKRTLTGTATFNVTPPQAGAYFNKLECFCFTEQTLQPGETVEMPVSFFIDPEMVKDRSARSITQVTLSYTFFPVAEEKRADVSVGKSKVTQ